MNQPDNPNTPGYTEFQGMFSDIDQMDVPDEYLYRQVNLLSEVNGQLTTRGGLRRVTLETLE